MPNRRPQLIGEGNLRKAKTLSEHEYAMMGDFEGAPTMFYGEVESWPSQTPLSRKFVQFVCANYGIKTWQDLRGVEFRMWMEGLKAADPKTEKWLRGEIKPGSREHAQIWRELIEHNGAAAESNVLSGLPLSILTIDLLSAMLGLYGHNRRYERILDIGCSHGALTSFLAMIFPECDVIGVDVSANAIALAKKKQPKLKNLHFVQQDAFVDSVREELLDGSAATLSVFSRFISQMMYRQGSCATAEEQINQHADLACQWLVAPGDAVVISELNPDPVSYIHWMAARVAFNKGPHSHVFHQNIGASFLRNDNYAGSTDIMAFASIYFAPSKEMKAYYGIPPPPSIRKSKSRGLHNRAKTPCDGS